jgi:hypothetical protein
MAQLRAAQGMGPPLQTSVTRGACIAFRVFAPAELVASPATASQLHVAAGICLSLIDIMFLNVKIVAFTGERARGQTNLATSALK